MSLRLRGFIRRVGGSSSSSSQEEDFESGSAATGGSHSSLRGLKIVCKVDEVDAGIETGRGQGEVAPSWPHLSLV